MIAEPSFNGAYTTKPKPELQPNNGMQHLDIHPTPPRLAAA